jgi:hypothetical protein
MKTLAPQLHLQIVPSLLARLSSQPVGQKRLANSIPRTAKVTIDATSTTSFFAVKESQFISIPQFSRHLNGGAR